MKTKFSPKLPPKSTSKLTSERPAKHVVEDVLSHSVTSDPADNNLTKAVILGKILKPHGLKGEIRLKIFTADPRAFRDYHAFIINGYRYPVSYFKQAGKYLIVKLATIDTIEAAKAIQGEHLTLSRDEILTRESAQEPILIADLINLEAYFTVSTEASIGSPHHKVQRKEQKEQETQERIIGRIIAYYEMGGSSGNGMLEVCIADEFRPLLAPCEQKRQTFFLPCDDEYFGKIDLPNQRICIENLPKLIELIPLT